MSKKVNRKVPKLRFSEFEGDWKKYKLSDLFSISAGGDIDSNKVRNEPDEIYKYPIYANAEKEKGLYGYSNEYKIEPNVITVAGRGVNIGITHVRDHRFYPIVRLLVLQPKTSLNIYFFEYQINRINICIESTGVPQLTAPTISSYKVSSTPIAEQEKIASFLGAVDIRISQLRRKHELLQTYKRGVMQKVFCRKLGKKKHKKKPELRLKKFIGDWKPVLVGSFIEAQNTIGSEDIPLYSLTIESGITEKTERYERQFLVKNEDEAYKLVRPNDFAYNPMNLRFGAIARHKRHISVKVSKYYDVFSIRSNVNLKFAEYLLRNEDSIQYYDSLASGSLIEKKRLHFSEFKKIFFLIPSLEEQEKIADFLTALDQKIEAVAKQIDLTEQFKKGLLQKMFV